MELFVNGQKLDITLEDEKNVGEVLKSFESECAKNNGTTISILLDGKIVSAENFEEACKIPIENVKKIELTAVFSANVKNELAQIAKTCKDFAQKVEEIPTKLQSGKDSEAFPIIAQLADLIDRICTAATFASLFSEEYSRIKIDGMDLANFFADLQPILADFEEALKNKDSVLVGDLSEYEIGPRLKNLSKALIALEE